jgi:hypothetical protein
VRVQAELHSCHPDSGGPQLAAACEGLAGDWFVLMTAALRLVVPTSRKSGEKWGTRAVLNARFLDFAIGFAERIRLLRSG